MFLAAGLPASDNNLSIINCHHSHWNGYLLDRIADPGAQVILVSLCYVVGVSPCSADRINTPPTHTGQPVSPEHTFHLRTHVQPYKEEKSEESKG